MTWTYSPQIKSRLLFRPSQPGAPIFICIFTLSDAHYYFFSFHVLNWHHTSSPQELYLVFYYCWSMGFAFFLILPENVFHLYFFKAVFTWYRVLGRQLSFCFLKVPFHCLWKFIISVEKSIISPMIVPLKIMCLTVCLLLWYSTQFSGILLCT